jgi:hypothetical protein
MAEQVGVLVQLEVLASLIGTVGTLAGVVVGVTLGGRSQTVAWKREKAERLRAERRRLYSDFLASARDWRAISLGPEVQIVEASAVSRFSHADGGTSAVRTQGLRIEIALVAETPAIVGQARAVVRTLAELAEARAQYTESLIPPHIVQACRDSEFQFVAAARRELGSSELGDDLARVFQPTASGVNA